MNVRLTPELESLIHHKVRNGRYTAASEVVREALRLMEARDQLHELYKSTVHEKIATGMSSLRAGRGVDGDAFIAKLDTDLAAHDQHQRQCPKTINSRPKRSTILPKSAATTSQRRVQRSPAMFCAK